jgi:Fe-S cluster biogenesis protein NfuA
MFIQTESTANPSTMKFLPGRTVLEQGSVEYGSANEARRSPLASRLFGVESVTRVAFGSDYVSVSKADPADWQLLKPAILGVIMEHFVAGRPVVGDGEAPVEDALTQSVRDLIETRIRPAINQSGGSIDLREVEGGIASVEMGGPPAANQTFRNGIENMIRHYVPEVTEVRFVAKVRTAADKPGLNSPEAIAIQTLLDEEINPSVASHGGFVSLVDVKDARAYIRLEGGCQGCGMADVTLRQGIEVAILDRVPTIKEVVDATAHAEGTNPYYEARA